MLRENKVENQAIRNDDILQLPNINDEEVDSRLSNQNKRQSSMIDFSHDHKEQKGGQTRRYGTSKRREAKQEKAEVCSLFKELIAIINTRYLTAQNFDSKSNNQQQMNPKKSAQLPKKPKEDQEKLTQKLRTEKQTKIKEKVNSIMAMDKKEAIKQQQDQLKGEVFNNYHLVMEYEIGEQSQMQQIELNPNGSTRNQFSNSDIGNNANPCILENPQRISIALGDNKNEAPLKQPINKIKAIRQKLSYHSLESITINPQFNNQGQSEGQAEAEDRKKQAEANMEDENMEVQSIADQEISQIEEIQQEEDMHIQIENENINDLDEQSENNNLVPVDDKSPSPLNSPQLPLPQNRKQNDPQI